MKRLLSDILCVAALLAALPLAAVALRSHSVEDRFYRARWKEGPGGAHGQTAHWLLSANGRVALGLTSLHVPADQWPMTDEQWAALEGAPVHAHHVIGIDPARAAVPAAGSPLNRAGFQWTDATQATADHVTLRYRELVLPYWFLLAILLAAPTWRAWRLARRALGRLATPVPAIEEPIAVPVRVRA